MKIIHKNGFSETELAEFRPVVYKNVLDSAQQVVLYMRKTGIECVDFSNKVCTLSSLSPFPSPLSPYPTLSFPIPSYAILLYPI